LGFEVRDGARGGHKIFVHPELTAFISGSFSCGHGKNSEIKRPYIKNIVNILDVHEDALKALLEETNHD